MKTYQPILIVTAFLAAAPVALAWPYFGRSAGDGAFGSDALRGELVQLDQDRTLEFFGGGQSLVNFTFAPNGVLTSQRTLLPKPDTDPYPSNFPVDFAHGRGATGDIDNDGDTDIVYSCVLRYSANEEFGNVRIVACLNDGNGGFTRQWQLKNTSAAVTYAPEVKLADFDNDGDLDLAETSNGLRILWNDGTGTFATTSPIIYNAYPSMPGFSTTPDMEVADFDGNGWMDIALFANIRLQPGDNRYVVTGRLTRLNNTNGSFTASVVQTNAVEKEFFSTAMGDFNGDGRMDLLAVKQSASDGRDLVWHRNNGVGFDPAVTLLSLPSVPGDEQVSLMTADLNEDGALDIVFSNRSLEIKWMPGAGDGTFGAAAVVPSGFTGTDDLPYSIAMGDLDGDGDIDLVSDRGANFFENQTPHLRSGAVAVAFSGTALSGAVDLATGDLNNDGKADLIAADGGGKLVRWYTGAASVLTERTPLSTGSTTPLGIVAGDWNSDGWTDLAWSGSDQLRQALSTNSGGTAWTQSSAATMTGISGLLAADMDRDRDLDILSFSTGGVVRIHSNNGTASIWLPQNVDTGVTGISRIACNELPGERPLIAGVGSTVASTWRFNTGSWVDTPIGTPSPLTASRGVCLADVRDSLPGPETIFSLNSNSLYYWNAALSGPVLIAQVSNPVVQLTAVDWNGDSYSDILVTTTTTVSIFQHSREQSNPFSDEAILLFTAPAGATLQDIATLDVNADRLPDAVVADSTGKLHILTNTSRAVEYTLTPSASSGTVAGSLGQVSNVHGRYRGSPGDALAGMGTFSLFFNRAVGTPGSDVAGSPMTDAEINALVDYISIRSQTDYGSTDATTVTPVFVSSGQLRVTPGTAFASQTAMHPYSAERDYTVSIHLKATAATAPVTRFFVLLPGVTWTPVDPWGGASPVTLRARTESTSQRVLMYVRAPGPLDTWRQTNFGTYDSLGGAANDADPDGDGVPNLMEYLTSQDPKVRGGIGSSQVVGVSYDAARGAMVPDLRLLTSYDSRVKVTLQYSQDPSSPWFTLSTRTGTAAWTGISPYVSAPLAGGRTRFAFDGGFAPSIWPRVFFRLKAEELP